MSYEVPAIPAWAEPLLDGQTWAAYALSDKPKKYMLWPSTEHPGFWFVSCVATRGGITETNRPVASFGVAPTLELLGASGDLHWHPLGLPKPKKRLGVSGESRDRVYFMVAGPFVKIGYSIDPEKRRAELQTGCPFPIEIAAAIPGRIADEYRLHARFSDLRVRADGEWFHHSGELARYIHRIQRAQS